MTKTLKVQLPQDGYAIHHHIEREGKEPLTALVNIGASLESLTAYVAKESAILAAHAPATTVHTYTIVTMVAGQIVEQGEGIVVRGGGTR